MASYSKKVCVHSFYINISPPPPLDCWAPDTHTQKFQLVVVYRRALDTAKVFPTVEQNQDDSYFC